MDPREARFLASQAERLAAGGGRKRRDGDAPPDPVDDYVGGRSDRDDGGAAVVAGGGRGKEGKEAGRRFFSNFRLACSDLRGRVDVLLLVPPPSAGSGGAEGEGAPASDDGEVPDRAGAYYATASRRNEGRIKLDSILRDVRSLQRHVLSSSSSAAVAPTGSSSNCTDKSNDNNDGGDALGSILREPMPGVTQTDVRLISQEIDNIMKRLDEAREVVCPKEKFVFKRYRRAMEELERNGGGAELSALAGEKVASEGGDDSRSGEGVATDRRDDDPRSAYGGALEDASDRTVEVSPDGAVLVDETPEDALGYYAAPRPASAPHPPSRPRPSAGASSYLLRNLRNVTLLLHGSRPSLHMRHIRDCRIYVTEPTLGAVHVTDCHSSTIRCSAYQLRVHDSTDVKFDVWTRSGPIIEGSRGMVFGGNYYAGGEEDQSEGIGRNMYRDVKDFNWLRALRKSPNFTVIGRSAGDSGEDVDEKEPVADGAGTEEKTIEAAGPAVVQEGGEEEDSEDEL